MSTVILTTYGRDVAARVLDTGEHNGLPRLHLEYERKDGKTVRRWHLKSNTKPAALLTTINSDVT